MPTYEYQCERCRRLLEIWQRITAEPLTRCEACGGPLRRLLSPAPFILKGEGWYVTDYPSESRKKALDAEKGGAAKADGKGASDGKGTSSGEQSSTSSGKEPSPTTGSAASSSPTTASST